MEQMDCMALYSLMISASMKGRPLFHVVCFDILALYYPYMDEEFYNRCMWRYL